MVRSRIFTKSYTGLVNILQHIRKALPGGCAVNRTLTAAPLKGVIFSRMCYKV